MLFKSIKGLSETLYYKLLSNFDSLEDIYKASINDLLYLSVPKNVAENIKNKVFNNDFVNREFDLAEKNNIKIIGFNDLDYPELLKEIPWPPYYLYTKGSLEALKKPTIAIVGSRKSSKNGLIFAEKIAYDLASVDFTVVSGFAKGIDISAHLGALQKGNTVAVIGSGFNNIYPASHKRYISSVLENGCIITEYPFDERPIPYNFPKRNRIISGLSLGVIVVEAEFKSGSLITVKYALEHNRAVFAVPHFPTNNSSAVNNLIKQGAIPVESYLDVVERFKYILKDYLKKEEKSSNTINFSTSIHELVYNTILKEPTNIDEICATLNIDIIQATSIISELELDNLIIKDENGQYIVSNGINRG